VLLCAELQDSMLVIKAPAPPPGKLGKEETCLVASQAYNIAVFVYNRLSVPLASAAARLAAARSDHRVYSCAFLFRS